MTVQRIGGVDIVAVTMRPEPLIALDAYVRAQLARDTRTTGARRAALVEAITAVNAAAAEAAEHLRTDRGWSTTSSGTGGFRAELGRSGLSVPGSFLAVAGPAPISVTEAAQRLGVSEAYVRRLCRQRRLQSWTGHRGAWLIDPAAVATWISPRHNDQGETA